jgi:hypothetical protein
LAIDSVTALAAVASAAKRIAEVGAAFLWADLELTLQPRADHASHIANWVEVLQNDSRAIFTAAAHAHLLLVVHGEVIAGMDLSKLQPSDVVISGRSVSIHLPQAEIFTTRLDNAKT